MVDCRPTPSVGQAAQVEAERAETADRGSAYWHGRVARQDFEGQALGAARSGGCQVGREAGVALAVGAPLMQRDEVVGGLLAMTQA